MPRPSTRSPSASPIPTAPDRQRIPPTELPRIPPIPFARSTCRWAPAARRKNFRQSQQPRARNFSSSWTAGETKRRRFRPESAKTKMNVIKNAHPRIETKSLAVLASLPCNATVNPTSAAHLTADAFARILLPSSGAWPRRTSHCPTIRNDFGSAR